MHHSRSVRVEFRFWMEFSEEGAHPFLDGLARDCRLEGLNASK